MQNKKKSICVEQIKTEGLKDDSIYTKRDLHQSLKKYIILTPEEYILEIAENL